MITQISGTLLRRHFGMRFESFVDLRHGIPSPDRRLRYHPPYLADEFRIQAVTPFMSRAKWVLRNGVIRRIVSARAKFDEALWFLRPPKVHLREEFAASVDGSFAQFLIAHGSDVRKRSGFVQCLFV